MAGRNAHQVTFTYYGHSEDVHRKYSQQGNEFYTLLGDILPYIIPFCVPEYAVTRFEVEILLMLHTDMIYHLIYDVDAICRKLVQDILTCSGLEFTLISRNELKIHSLIAEDVVVKLNLIFNQSGIQVVSTPQDILVQRIKSVIRELINMEESVIVSKTSCHLSGILNQDYRYLSRVFSEVTYTTIENYIILQKIEKAKEMITIDELTFTEIASKLNYSSVAHFSMQFKNTTGFTPSTFKRIINQKKRVAVVNARG